MPLARGAEGVAAIGAAGGAFRVVMRVSGQGVPYYQMGRALFGDDRLSAALLAAVSEDIGPLIEHIDRMVDESAADQPQANAITMLSLSFRAL
jgi:hypothetical protein